MIQGDSEAKAKELEDKRSRLLQQHPLRVKAVLKIAGRSASLGYFVDWYPAEV